MSVALLLIFLGLMALGVPIAISLGAASVIVLITMGNMPLTMVVQLMYTSYNNNYGLRRGSQPRLFPSQSRSC